MPIDWAALCHEILSEVPPVELPSHIKLPALPQSVLAFTLAAQDPEATNAQLAAPIESDTALASEVLRQVNSAAFGVRQQVLAVSQAITLLGLRRTKTLVLTSALQNAVARKSSSVINITRLQKENRVRALFAYFTARAIGCDSQLAYMGGLLQDFLLPLLADAYESDYRQALQSEMDLVEMERTRFGWDHAGVSGRLMQEWCFPEELICCVLLHHSPERVLADEQLRCSPAAATLAAACLPESLGQSSSGFDILMQLQNVIPNFRFLEIAAAADDELAIVDPAYGHHTDTLCDSLGKLVTAHLEDRRLESIHRLRQLGNYTLDEQLGSGGMGVVYRAHHCMLKRPVAIKLLHSTKVTPQALALFEAEVQLTARLTSPHTVAVHEYGVTSDGLFYYVMEYVEGVTLIRFVEQYGPLPCGRVIHVLRQACASLAEAHANRLIHRDLKPENLMLCRRGGIDDTVKVLDFGLAKFVSDHPERDNFTEGLTGTPLYMPPEAIVAPHKVDARSDLYSLGAVGYLLLTGSPVFRAATIPDLLRKHVGTAPERPSTRMEQPNDETLENLILSCLAKDPAMRPGSAQDLADALALCPSAATWNSRYAEQWWQQQTAGRVIGSSGAMNSDCFAKTGIIATEEQGDLIHSDPVLIAQSDP